MSPPRCVVCSEANVEDGHDQSQRHLKNLLLAQLAKNNKLYAENRNGVVVSSTVRPTAYNAAPLHVDVEQSVLKVSVKPREGVNFTFTIKNENAKEEIIFRGVTTLAASNSLFTLVNENLSFGATDCRIPPRTRLDEEISVNFDSCVVGVYKQPIYFVFKHASTAECTIILKEMLVFVEAVKRKHEKVESPYALQPVLAEKIERTTARKKGENDEFKIPSKDLKIIFSRDLKTEGDDVTDEQKVNVEKLKTIFVEGPTEWNYIQLFHNLLWYEETVIGSNLKNYNMSGVLLRPSVSHKSYSLLVPGLAEKRPSLLRGDLAYVRPHNKTEVMYEAIITEIQDNYAMFGGLSPAFHKTYKSDAKFDVRFCMSRMPLERMHVAVDSVRREHMHTKTFPKGNEFDKTYKSDAKFDVRFCMSRMPLERMHVAVDSVRREHMHTKTFPKGNEFDKTYKSDAKFDVRFCMSRMPLERMHVAVESVRREHMHTKTFSKGNERVPPIKRIHNFYNPLVLNNPEQRAVVEHIVSGSSGTAPYLLHGPPGTGKTVTIVEAILQLAKTSTNHILVCTDSNMAADHVATLLIKYADKFPQKEFLLRANSEFRVWEPMPASLAPYSNGTSRGNWTAVSIAKFMSYRIVITTLVHSAKFANELKKKNHQRVTTHVFIDEAAQASEPASLIPLCGLLKPGGALVLAGDPMQLGPVVIAREAARLGLGISLMERLKRDCVLYSDDKKDPNFIMMLKKNFRSHRDILSIPDQLFYHGQLEAMAPVDHISSVDILGERENSRAIVFYGVPSQEQREGKSPSFYNHSELEVVQSHITKLLEVHRVAQDDIGVVTPYIRQVYKMKQWLKERELKIEVGTVEAFQGKEKRIILVSTVRARCDLVAHDAKFRLGFLVDPKRYNVALTRAKAKLIVVGNPTCLQRDPNWRRYMAKCRELGTYHGLDLGEEEPQNETLDQIRHILDLTSTLEQLQLTDALNNMTI